MQALAKKHGVRANLKSIDIINDILTKTYNPEMMNNENKENIPLKSDFVHKEQLTQIDLFKLISKGVLVY